MYPLKLTCSLLGGLFLFNSLAAQTEEVPKNWYLEDRNTSGYFGISLEKAYQFLQQKKLHSKPVIVAVIDSGIDTVHEDLKQVLWKNPKEIPGNNIDDDKNGYVDDVYGWNFIGNKDGQNLIKDSEASSRLYHHNKEKWEQQELHPQKLSAEDSVEFSVWKQAKENIMAEYKESIAELDFVKKTYEEGVYNDSLLQQAMDREIYTVQQLSDFNPNGSDKLAKAKRYVYGLMAQNDALESTNQEFLQNFKQYIRSEETKRQQILAPPANYRNDIVKDKYADTADRFYGNNNVMVNSNAAMHGTFVAGIIGASRSNGIGINGIADNVQIMSIRILPDGDFHDKDLANAIRYAVDNGARIINLSFGKKLSGNKPWVDEAVRYAEKKDVLVVHAVGNASKYLTPQNNFPTAFYLDGTRAGNWISVGSSGDPKLGGVSTSFTNYGKKVVDVFAPGIKIYTTVPGNSYKNLQGTGTSCPIVSGIAALLLEYFPSLTAAQLKMIIEKSAVDPDMEVKLPGKEDLVPFNSLCGSGGIVNAFEAVKMASMTRGSRK